MTRPAIIHHVRTVEPVANMHAAAQRIGMLSGGAAVTLSPLQTAAIPGLGVGPCVAVRMMDARGPTDICTVALGPFDRADLMSALAASYAARRAA